MTDIVRVKAPGGAEQLDFVTVELPPPSRGEVRLRQTLIGVNFIDVYQRMGLYGLSPAGVPGVEAVAVVAACGEDVRGLAVGDRVAYAGTPVGAYASERNLPAWRCIRLPDTLSDEAVAASFVKGITADMLLNRVFPVARGTTILVHSAAARVLAAIGAGVLRASGTEYGLSEAVQAHVDLEAGRTTGSLYLRL